MLYEVITPLPEVQQANTAGFIDLGLQPYKKVHALQVQLAEARYRGTVAHDQFLCVEHPVITSYSIHYTKLYDKGSLESVLWSFS